MDTNLTHSKATAKIIAMPPLLQRLSADAFLEPLQTKEEIEEEAIRKRFEEKCKPLGRYALMTVCKDYNVWRAKTIISLHNDKQTA